MKYVPFCALVVFASFVLPLAWAEAPGADRPQPASSLKSASTYDVRAFGATGDGVTKDTAAFQRALDACAVNGGGEVHVPAGRFLIGSVQLGQRTILRLERDSVLVGSPDADDYPMMDVRWEGRWQPGRRALIYAANVDHTGIVGPGRIEGNAAVAAPQNPRGAVVLEPINCDDVRWEDFTVTQGGNWATHPTFCQNVLIKNVTITGRRDGIDIDSCRDVVIDGCTIDTGDDAISLKSGRGLNGARVGKPTENVVIKNCTLKCSRFATIGIGSETSGGVRNVLIENCKMTAKSAAIYIKSRVGRAGVTEKITGKNLEISGGGFLSINLTSAGNKNTVDDPVEGPIGYPIARDLVFERIRLLDAAFVVSATNISSEKPIERLSLVDISGTAKKGMTLVNVKGARLTDLNVTAVEGPLLSTNGVTGEGLSGAVPYEAKPSEKR